MFSSPCYWDQTGEAAFAAFEFQAYSLQPTESSVISRFSQPPKPVAREHYFFDAPEKSEDSSKTILFSPVLTVAVSPDVSSSPYA